MTNTTQIEQMYGKPIKDWDVSDFNIIAQTKPEIAELLDVETCRECATREDLPVAVKKVFMGYILIIAFKDANDRVEANLQEWGKKYEKSETPVTEILGQLEGMLLDMKESDYARLRAVNTMLAYWSAQDNPKERCTLHAHKEIIKGLLEGLLEDLEFMGVRMFILYTFQYIDLLYSTAAFYHQIYEEDLLKEYEPRLNVINDEYAAIMKDMEAIITADPELAKKLESIDPEDLGMPDIFEEEDNNENNESTGTGETTESV